jgi:molybdate transport system substrate-binding protein
LKIVVLSALALKGVLEKSKTEFERSLGAPLELHFDATQTILPRLASGFRADLVVVTAEAMKELLVTGVRPLGSSGVGVAVKAGARKPDIGSVEAFKRALENARSVAHSKVGASGIYFAELVEKLGIRLKNRIVVEKGPVGLVVARGEAEIGLQQICELEPVPGIDIVGPLPAPIQKLTQFAGGIPANAANGAGGKALLALLPVLTT